MKGIFIRALARALTGYGSLVGQRRWAIAVVVGLSVLVTLLEGSAILVLIPLIEVGMGAGPTSQIAMLAQEVAQAFSVELGVPQILAVFVALGVCSAVFGYRKEVAVSKLGIRVETDCRNNMYRSIMESNWPVITQKKAGELLKSVLGDPQQIRMGFISFVQTLALGAAVLVYFGFAMKLSPGLTLLVIVFAVIGLLPYYWFLRRGQAAGKRFNEAWRAVFANTSDSVGNLKLIFSQGLREYSERTSRKLVERARDEWLAKRLEGLRSRFIFEGAGVVFVAGVLFAHLEILGGELSTGIAFLGIFVRLAPRIVTLQSSYFEAVALSPWVLAWKDLLVTISRSPAPVGKGRMPAFEQEIELDGVSFTYPDADKPTLESINMRIPKRGAVAVTAPSGRGKTTMLSVLCGLLHPQDGTVRIDGVPLEEFDLQIWQSRIGLVLQENPMFHATVRENIAWGNGHDIDDERVREVCEMAGALDFVSMLPNGVDTIIGDQGSRLSGGQRQRIAIARALYRMPLILLLDEATNALDAESETMIIETLEKLKREIPLVIVCHRGALMGLADTVYEL